MRIGMTAYFILFSEYAYLYASSQTIFINWGSVIYIHGVCRYVLKCNKNYDFFLLIPFRIFF